MKTTLNIVVAVVLCASLFFSCTPQKKTEVDNSFVLNGSVEGLQDGVIVLYYSNNDKHEQDTAKVSEGKFTFSGNISEPCQAFMQMRDAGLFLNFYAESGEITVTGKADSIRNLKVVAGEAQEILNIFNNGSDSIHAKYDIDFRALNNPNTPKERKDELEGLLKQMREETEAYNKNFINKYPTSLHAAILASQEVRGKSAVETIRILNELPAEMQDNPKIISMKAKAEEMKEFEVGLDKIMANASNVSYKVDDKFNGEDLKGIIYMGLSKSNNICALKKDGTVQVLDINGKKLNEFKPELKDQPSSIAVDENSIYLMTTSYKKVTKKIRGKEREVSVPTGVTCNVFNYKGEAKTNFELAGTISATGARIVDNNLVIADCKKAKIAMYNKESGEAGAVINDMRPCCGILDFSVNEKNEILVANLGAFRVQGFDFTGKKLVQFGSRGKSLNEFHGCCNPVSVAYLSNGAIVTVEKDPTRIKVYSKEGAKEIEGIEELVKGCSYIPMIVDKNDNLYLASASKGVVKCVSVN